MQDVADKSEPREIELKLELEPEAVDRIIAHPYFASPATKTKHLRSEYLDTPKLALRQHGFVLRIREDGGGFVQTIKAEPKSAGLLLDRGEWEVPLQSNAPDFAAAAETPLQPLLRDGAARRKLKPAFKVEVERTVARRRVGGSKVELALDRGRVTSDRNETPISEIELELVDGVASDLFAAALELAKAAPLRLSLLTKADRGYALLGEKSAQKAAKAEPVHLPEGASAADAFQVIARACMRQLLKNEWLLRRQAHEDAVHQARVAIRRLRAALSLFKDVVADDEVGWVKSELKWMADQLGKARDLDVFIADVLEPAAKGPDAGPAEAALADFRSRRDAAYSDAVEAVASPRFGRSIIRVAAWIETGSWLANAGRAPDGTAAQNAASFARAELSRRWRKLRRNLKGIDTVDAERRHRVRIEVKKVRYAMEFFGSLFERSGRESRVRAMLEGVEALQGSLGELNDIAVARSLGSTPALEPLLRGREEKAPALLKLAAKQAAELRRIEPFWT